MKKIISIVLIFLLIISINVISNAGVQISDNAGTDWKPSATNAYQICYDMRYSTSSLGDNTLDPHLMLNADWGAMVYLGASAYGNISNSPTTTSTGNETGVKDINKWNLCTSSIVENPTIKTNFTNILNNKGTRYVETLPSSMTKENTRGLATIETNIWFSGNTPSSLGGNYPLIQRQKLFGYYQSDGSQSLYNFRPVIWN